MALPDDDQDDPLPRRRPAIDEVQAAHAAAGEPLPPLGPTNGASLPPSPMGGGMGGPLPSSPMGGGMGSQQPNNGLGGAPQYQQPNNGLGGAPQYQPPPSNPTVMNNTTVIGGNGGSAALGAAMMNQQTVQTQSIAATAQAQASVGLAQTNLDEKVIDEQLKKEDEHWVKAYWRPAMGWLYMAICFMDFIGFPAISMFLPVVMKGFGIQMQYVAWQSLTLSNGGLIHLAFGAILGVSAWTRGQEKLAKM